MDKGQVQMVVSRPKQGKSRVVDSLNALKRLTALALVAAARDEENTFGTMETDIAKDYDVIQKLILFGDN